MNKTIEEIQEILAQKYSWDNWNHVPNDIKLKLIKDIANIHAKQCCDLQIEACSERASSNCFASINTTPNVAENK